MLTNVWATGKFDVGLNLCWIPNFIQKNRFFCTQWCNSATLRMFIMVLRSVNMNNGTFPSNKNLQLLHSYFDTWDSPASSTKIPHCGKLRKRKCKPMCEVSITKVQPPAIVFKLRDNRMFSDVTKANDMISVSLTVSCCPAYPGQLAWITCSLRAQARCYPNEQTQCRESFYKILQGLGLKLEYKRMGSAFKLDFAS